MSDDTGRIPANSGDFGSEEQLPHEAYGCEPDGTQALRVSARRDRQKWSDEQILTALRVDALRLGRPPRLDEWDRATADRPHGSTVRARFGSWNAALTAAGLPTVVFREIALGKLREIAAGRRAATHCARGHAYTEGNTGRRSNGARRCRACNREHARVHQAGVRAHRQAVFERAFGKDAA